MALCPICKSKATKRYGLKMFCDDINHVIEWTKIAQDKARAKKQSESRRQDREKLKSLKTRSEWLKDAQAIFNKYVRLRDKGIPCISCGHPDDGSRQRHASHYKSVGGNPALRFNPSNCNASCSICNNYLSGNLVPYRAALIQKIGLDEVEKLEGPQEVLKLTISEIQALIAEYKAKIKQLVQPL